ncbi:fused MFS/spermidine synthase [Bradyrhizobium sediminis]|uniref:Fused MFS/spermidine synthase n=2 Tax=Bradyrhizobium sediminis TaxID=2840469 RepID=A0A975RVI7_9BRAD|nr:fused MFS/spermidine synthase [Bradyrhizobium sediminis]
MTVFDRTIGQAPKAIASDSLRLATFIAAIFASAALLFSVEPMFTKMVLPRLGGSAAVWTTATVFFQAMLLAGYVYAHLLMRFVPLRLALVIHVIVTAAACAALPLHIAADWGRPPAEGETFWLIGLFTASIGLPFFALSANGPLLQAWFARTDHPSAQDPYFLYVASNIGSFLALVSYPFVVEPFVGLGAQTWFWTVGFYGLIALIGGCATLSLRSRVLPSHTVTVEALAAPPSWRNVASCIGLSAVPSGLLLAVTAYMSTDVAAVPLFWVLPLALYLLSLVIAFQTRPLIPHWLVVRAFPAFILLLVVFVSINPVEWLISSLSVHIAAFFVTALMCHGELARRRPAARYLTNFYIWLSSGGLIGGITTGLVAPHLFTWVAEYPILIVLAILCVPPATASIGRALTDSAMRKLLLVALTAAALAVFVLKWVDIQFDTASIIVMNGLLLGATVYYWRAPVSFAAIIAFIFFTNAYGFHYGREGYVVRNFFGVLNAAETSDGRFRVLWHGTIGQGSQRIRDDLGVRVTGRPEMVAEFFDGAGIAQTVDAVRARVGGPIKMAVIGLGTGALTCRTKPGDSVTFYEIDPDVIRVARDPKLFNYISECGPGTEIVQGDARLTLSDASAEPYDLIFIDAFLGAAIPIHLLTREAMAMYFGKLAPNGIVAVHVSNRNMELASVVAGVAEANGAIARYYRGGDVQESVHENKWVPKVVAVARGEQDFGGLAKSRYWPVLHRDPAQDVWSDDYSNVLGALMRKWNERAGLAAISLNK